MLFALEDSKLLKIKINIFFRFYEKLLFRVVGHFLGLFKIFMRVFCIPSVKENAGINGLTGQESQIKEMILKESAGSTFFIG